MVFISRNPLSNHTDVWKQRGVHGRGNPFPDRQPKTSLVSLYALCLSHRKPQDLPALAQDGGPGMRIQQMGTDAFP